MSFNEEWDEIYLEDIAKYRNDKTNINQVKLEDYISTTNMLSDKAGVEMIDKKPKINNVKIFKKNDILVSNIRPYFKKIWFANKSGGCSNDVLVITNYASNRVLNRYLFYYLNQDKFFDYMMQSAKGTKMPRGDKNAIMKFNINLPPIDEQKAIANILSKLDEKTEINNQMDETLEEMAQTIYKSWFVDFEPFQDGNFVESELGMIPEGWEVVKLKEILSLKNGKRPNDRQDNRSKKYQIPVVGASGVMAYTEEELYNEPILVVGRVGTLGIVQRYNSPCWTSDNTIVIKSDFYEYAYQVLKTINFKSLNRGSTQPLIAQKDIKKVKVALPPEEILIDFEKIIKKLFIKIDQNNKQNQTLKQLRDTLLPKLMSGEIRVPMEE